MHQRVRSTNKSSSVIAETRVLLAGASAALLGLAGLPMLTAQSASADPLITCVGERWVRSAMAAPSDSASVVDAALIPTMAVANQTFRVVMTPHRGGDTVRIHLTNRFRPVPIEFAHVTIGRQLSGGAVVPDSVREVTFLGRPDITLPGGADAVSDPIAVRVDAWQPLAVSVYVPGLAVLPTEHFNGNATSHYGPPGSGDHAADPSGHALSMSTTAVPFSSGLDVAAPAEVSTLVTLGDSITDGFVAGELFGFPNPLGFPQSPGGVDTNQRYPDYLQRRIDSAELPMSVVNAGISGNRVIADGLVPQFADSMVERLDRDALDIASVSDVLILGGTNDLGLPIGASFEQVTAGYINLISRLQSRGVKVHLGTIPPSSNSLLDGILTLPYANPVRLRVNDWIRSGSGVSVVDFDAAVRDPDDPNVLSPAFAGNDNLHLSAAGNEAMANVVDLAALQGSRC